VATCRNSTHTIEHAYELRQVSANRQSNLPLSNQVLQQLHQQHGVPDGFTDHMPITFLSGACDLLHGSHMWIVSEVKLYFVVCSARFVVLLGMSVRINRV